MEKKKYYALTEQGDMGLGADILGSSDQKVMHENAKRDDEKEEKDRKLKNHSNKGRKDDE